MTVIFLRFSHRSQYHSVSYSVSPPTSSLWSSMTDWFSSFSSCWLVSFRSSLHSVSLWPGLLHYLHVHWFEHSYCLWPCCRHLLHLNVCFLGSIWSLCIIVAKYLPIPTDFGRDFPGLSQMNILSPVWQYVKKQSTLVFLCSGYVSRTLAVSLDTYIFVHRLQNRGQLSPLSGNDLVFLLLLL